MNRTTLPWPLRLCVLLGLGALTGWASDEPPADDGFRIIERAPITIPLRALNEGVTSGVVQMTLLIDAEGKLSDTLVTAYTNRHLAEASRAAVDSWLFTPSRIDGKQVPTVLELQVVFQSDGMVVWDRPSGAEAPPSPIAYAYYPARLQELDRPLRPVHTESPSYPEQWARDGLTGRVTLRFYIDEEGRPRMAVVEGEAHPYLASLALHAIERWRFDPPRSQGRPVLVRAAQHFNFAATSP